PGGGEGEAFVFDRGPGGAYTQTQALLPSNPSGGDNFGYATSLDYPGNLALIGAPGGNGGTGAAFTFAGFRTLTQQRELTEPPPSASDAYGYSTAIDALGDELLIGAPFANDAQGAAWAAPNNPIG
ncbi:MAG: hypothetical protein JO130_14650, partial [Solirubrobacterales bacterium]|nr:hypothetical protein [Solirubrobacterales bacterium]